MRRVVQQRLLDIAIEQFGQHGLEGASTRQIATAAGTAMSSITYHYGGKEGLYLAAAGHIADQMGEMMRPAITASDWIAAGERDAARQAIHDLIGALLAAMSADKSESWSLFMVREQTRPTAAFDLLYDGAMGLMLQRLVDLVCIATDSRDDEAARIVALALFGQVLVTRSARSAVLRLLDRATLDETLIDRLRNRIRTNTDAILDAMAAEQGNPQ